MRDALSGKERDALDRYIQNANTIEARWLVLRVMGIGSSALVFAHQWGWLGTFWIPVLALLSTLGVYGLASAALMALFERTPERSATWLLRMLAPMELLVAPFAAPLVLLGGLLGRNEGPPTPPVEVAENEVELVVSESEQAGALDHEQSEMIRNVIDFGDLTAGEVMVPRTRVTAFEIGLSGEELFPRAVEAEHSRYPIYRDTIDNVVGVLHVKDLLTHVAGHPGESFQLEQIMRGPVVFVPVSQSASGVLRDMRAARQHLAVVLDEFGGMSGIVTLEDLLEEIVGEIRDEHDDEDASIVELGGGRVLVDASVAIDDLSRYLGASLPEDGEYNSLGGFIVERLGRVPRSGARLSAHGLEFIVREASDRKVSKVEIVRQGSNPPDPEPRSGSSRAA